MNVMGVRSDLIAEQNALDRIVSSIETSQWSLESPSPGWSVADQIAHLAYFDNAAALAISDPEQFQNTLDDLLAMFSRGDDAEASMLASYRLMSPDELLESWREARLTLADTSGDLTDKRRVVWYGPSMGSKSFLTARLMEVWAHGQDILDAVGLERDETDRLHHIAQLGFITRSWSYINRGLEPSETPIRVTLESPSGVIWEFGPDDASERISGSARDFCLVTTQRRNLEDTSIDIHGDAALEWLMIAQAFAGPATDGPAPR